MTVTIITTYISPGNDRDEDVFDCTNSGNVVITFYKEGLDGDYEVADTSNTDTGSNGYVRYNINDKYNGFIPFRYTADKYNTKELETKDSNGYYASVDFSSSLDIYFKRNSYNLSFYNYDEVTKTEQVKYEASLSDKNYTPSHPASLDTEYQFKGWYKDKACTNKFDFNTKMPAHGITLYAKRAAPDVNVTVSLDSDKTQTISNLPFRSTIDLKDQPTVKDSDRKVIVDGNDDYTYTLQKGSHWVGWATKDDNDNYTLFNFNTELKKNVTLYPYVIDSNK